MNRSLFMFIVLEFFFVFFCKMLFMFRKVKEMLEKVMIGRLLFWFIDIYVVVFEIFFMYLILIMWLLLWYMLWWVVWNVIGCVWRVLKEFFLFYVYFVDNMLLLLKKLGMLFKVLEVKDLNYRMWFNLIVGLSKINKEFFVRDMLWSKGFLLFLKVVFV